MFAVNFEENPRYVCTRMYLFSLFLSLLWQPEMSVLVDALEQSACNPEVSTVIGKSILRILQLSAEKTIASFKTLNAVPRVLKVACIQAQESKRLRNISPSSRSDLIKMLPSHIHWKDDLPEATQSWLKCIETSIELFTEFVTVADDGKSLVLNSSTCIDCLFDLFWEEGLRSHVLKHVIELMKVPFYAFVSMEFW